MKIIIIYLMGLLLSFMPSSTYGQNISGKVTDENNKSLAYANIVLLSMPDSAFVSGTISDEKGLFVLPLQKNGTLIRISAVGYIAVYKRSTDNDFDLVRMSPDSANYTLSEVVVTANMPQVKNYGSTSLIRVKNTVLSNMGSALDMLAFTPGLYQGPNGIEVNGLGTPIFILDEREINSTQVLELLRSNNVKEIEIERVPSIEYSSDGRPVVKITTVKAINDFYPYP